MAHEVKKELEVNKSFIAVEYIKGNLPRTELVKFLGKKDAGDVDYIMKKTKEGFKAAKEPAKKLKR